MEKQSDLEFERVLENIRNHFGSLFQRGYQISAAMFTDTRNKEWNVILTGNNCVIKIYRQNDQLRLALCSVQLFDKTGMFDLHDLVDLMNRKGNLPKRGKRQSNETDQFVATAWLLEKHIDEILLLFQKIYTGISFSQAGQLSNDNSPALFFSQDDRAAHAASA